MWRTFIYDITTAVQQPWTVKEKEKEKEKEKDEALTIVDTGAHLLRLIEKPGRVSLRRTRTPGSDTAETARGARAGRSGQRVGPKKGCAAAKAASTQQQQQQQ